MSYYINQFYIDAAKKIDSFTTLTMTSPVRRKRLSILAKKIDRLEWLLSTMKVQNAFNRALKLPLMAVNIDTQKKEAYFGY